MIRAPEAVGTPRPASRPPRRDVERNREALLSAAREEFATHGLGAPLEHIARRAGLGIATLYRHFPVRAQLVDAVLTRAVQARVAIARRALSVEDPWDGLVTYLEESGRLEAADRSINDLMSVRLPEADQAEAAKAVLRGLVARIVRRAQDSGQLRRDLCPQDLLFVTWGNARILDATADVAPDAWRRHLGFLLDAFRADAAHELPTPPLTPRQTHDAMVGLGRGPAGCAAD